MKSRRGWGNHLPVAAPQYQVDSIIEQSRRAREYLRPDNLPVRTAVTRTLGIAYQFQGNRAAASYR